MVWPPSAIGQIWQPRRQTLPSLCPQSVLSVAVRCSEAFWHLAAARRQSRDALRRD